MQHSSSKNRKKVETSSFLLTQLPKKRSSTIIAIPPWRAHLPCFNQPSTVPGVGRKDESCTRGALLHLDVTSHRKKPSMEKEFFCLDSSVFSSFVVFGFCTYARVGIDIYLLYPYIIIPAMCIYKYIYMSIVYTLSISTHQNSFFVLW